ncbi:MAG: hypothetical protein AB7O48_14895 [Cyclobacteriaceae bacterium]
MKIAVLGWGSLVYDPRQLRINKSIGNNGWCEDGPRLPIEFARISHNKRLTLIVFPEADLINTYWAESLDTELMVAMENLRDREGMPTVDRIGFVDLISVTRSAFSSHDDLQRIESWAHEKSFDSVIWTGLKSNFRDQTEGLFNERRSFTLENIKWYVSNLNKAELERALTYVIDAPKATKTKYRNIIKGYIEEKLNEQI